MVCPLPSSTPYRLSLLSLGTSLILFAAAPAVRAQARQADPPAHVSLVEGTAVLERDGRTDSSPVSMPLLAGDRLRTTAGRVEIVYADGSTLHLDSSTVVDFQSDEVIRLLEGRIRLHIAGTDRRVSYRIDAPSAWVRVTDPGEYRLAILDGERGREVELAVLRGAAELTNEDGSTALVAGERAFASPGAAPSSPYIFNSAAWDAFDRWSEARRDERLGLSAQYLPSDVRVYARTFDRYGHWRHEPTYGYVWYPAVNVGWRPYYHGRWRHFRPYGWTWIGLDPWAWPTHHYGRWGFSAGLWFWIPGRHWSPAWVSWAYAPGYVSWCPLGWNNRPVFSFVNVTLYGGRRYEPWHGWTVVPHRSFTGGYVNVGLNVVNATRLDGRTREAFTIRQAAPEFRGYAVPRSGAPIRAAGASPDGIAGAAAGTFESSPRGPATPSARTRDGAGANAPRARRGSVGEPPDVGLSGPSRDSRTASPALRGTAPAEQGDRAVERRAVPRSGSVEPRLPERMHPSQRAVPQNERSPGVIRRGEGGPSPARSPAPVDRYRVPNQAYPGAPRVDRSDRLDRSAPDSPYGRPRAVPRAPDADVSPPAPGIERRGPAGSRPSGPPPSAVPSRPSGPPSSSAAPARPGGPPRSGAPPSSGGQGSSSAGSDSSGSRSGGNAPAARPRGGRPSGGFAVRRGG